ncbi:MAG TPA: flagellar hook-associated protein FlgK, partial [Kiloniellales bacterium]|nr:flagellar hook-associated protein FlgK [Kiloniellales bacterium]
MSLIGSLYSAVSGLQTAQKQLQVVSNNIANVNTEGYTRKIAAPESVVLDGQGAGVRLTEIQRTVDENLLKQLREHIARLTGQQVESHYLERTQTLFGSPANNSSLSHTITTLGTALEALAADPENLVNRSNVLDSARLLAEQLNYTSDNVQRLRLDADRQIGESVTRINDLLGEIHEYNQEISRALALGNSAADLEDQRDTLLTRLSEEIDIKYFKRTTGEVAISTSS